MKCIVVAFLLLLSPACTRKKKPLKEEALAFFERLKQVILERDGEKLWQLLHFSVRQSIRKQLSVVQRTVRENPKEGEKMLKKYKLPYPDFLKWTPQKWLSELLKRADLKGFSKVRPLLVRLLPHKIRTLQRAEVVFQLPGDSKFYKLKLRWQADEWSLEKLEKETRLREIQIQKR